MMKNYWVFDVDTQGIIICAVGNSALIEEAGTGNQYYTYITNLLPVFSDDDKSFAETFSYIKGIREEFSEFF